MSNYSIGHKIRKIRECKRISFSQFAKILKIEEKKLSKIEDGEIIPKTPLLNRISKALDIDPRVLEKPDINDPIGVLYLLFELEERYGLNIDLIDNKMVLSFENGEDGQINRYLKKWRRTKACLGKKIDKNCYNEWKWNFPYYDLS